MCHLTAVAVKKLGFKNIKIYNGGLKDWKKAGHPTDSIDPLPDYEGEFITVAELLEKLNRAEETNCLDGDKYAVTILDYRVNRAWGGIENTVDIVTSCRVVAFLFDDIQKEEIRKLIPRSGTAVLLSETGNRDKVAMQFLSKYGYTNIVGLKFGMRGWIKAGYPITTPGE